MKHTLLLAAALLAAPAMAVAKGNADWIAASGRTEANVKLDEARKPVETLRFLGVKKGAAALDWEAGGGYYTEILARAVGRKGSVTAWNAAQFADDPKGKERWAKIVSGNPNVKLLVQPFEKFDAPANSYDFAIFHLSYHDAYWEDEKYKVGRQDPEVLLGNLYRAMKSGGVVGIVDHYGATGQAPRDAVGKFHRIDPAVVKADFARAGFRLAGESGHLRTSGDDYAKNVFDPSVRGKTDRFVMKFVKPKR